MYLIVYVVAIVYSSTMRSLAIAIGDSISPRGIGVDNAGHIGGFVGKLLLT